MDESSPEFNEKVQAAATSLIMYMADEGFTVPQGAMVFTMAMATACYKFGMSEREVMGKVGMTVRTMYKRLEDQERKEKHYV